MESISSPNVDIAKFLPPDQSKAASRKCPGFVLQMLEEGVHADVTLTANGGSVKAHRSVLSCVSPVFSAMFQHDMKEQATACVDIPDMTIDALQLFLLVIYTAKEVDKRASPNGMHRRLSAAIDKHFVEFYDAVLKYQVERYLKYVLKCALLRNLSPENCFYYLERANQSKETCGLKGRLLCVSYILGNYSKVIRSKQIQVEMQRNSDLVHQMIIAADTPARRKEAVQWFQHKKRRWEAMSE